MARLLLGLGVTFVAAWCMATFFLILRCRGLGRPFGPSARWWALAVLGLTSVVSTIAAFIVDIGEGMLTTVVGAVLPSGLLLEKLRRPPPEDKRPRLQDMPSLLLSWLLRRLDEEMAYEQRLWCEERVDESWDSAQLRSAAHHYHERLRSFLSQAKQHAEIEEIDGFLRAIEERLDVVRLIDDDAPEQKVRYSLGSFSVTRDRHYERYLDEPMRLADRLLHDATEDLIQLLGVGYPRTHKHLVVLGD